LEPGIIEVWYAKLELVADAEAIERCRARLSTDDLARIGRSASDTDRHDRLVAWSLARVTLSRHADVAPEAWRFRETEHGRPEIAGPAGAPTLRFNLSHTTGLAACAVTLTDDLGLDVEDLRRGTDLEKLARRFFARSETASLERLNDEHRRRAFFEYWTLKEAYLKARGAGISLPLAEVAFNVAPDGGTAVSFGPAIGDDPAAWQFAHLRVTPDHLGAIAVKRPAASPVRIVLRQAIPGVHF
jgi:4'-phosphopantetheinyl transferase